MSSYVRSMQNKGWYMPALHRQEMTEMTMMMTMMTAVQVHSRFSNRTPQTGWLINNRNSLHTVLEAWTSKLKGQLRALFQVHGRHLPAVTLHDGRRQRALWGLSYKSTNPTNSTSWPKYFPKALPGIMTALAQGSGSSLTWRVASISPQQG